MKKSLFRLALTLTPFIAVLGGCGGGDNTTYAGAVTTFAGMAGVSGVANATTIGTDARFNSPAGIATDGTNLYITDTDSHTIRKIVISVSGVPVTTLAGTAGIPGSTNGTGTSALFFLPSGIARDGTDLYVADTANSSIRQIDLFAGISAASSVITTYAGSVTSGDGDGTGTVAKFKFPFGIVWNTITTNLYVADSNNNTIRQITIVPAGEVTTIAGNAASSIGSTDGVGTDARFNNPAGITTDGTYLYVADTSNHTIRRIDVSSASAVVSTVAGSAGIPDSLDGIGTAARFRSPEGIIWIGGNLYVADTGNHTIRQIVLATGVVTTLAGAAGSNGSADGTGLAARFKSPSGITKDGASLYVTDTGNHTIRRIQ